MEYPRASDYFVYMVNRTTVRFRELKVPDQDKHVLPLLKNNSYEEVVTALGNILNVDPFKIRLTAHSTYSHPSPPSCIRRGLTLLLAYTTAPVPILSNPQMGRP